MNRHSRGCYRRPAGLLCSSVKRAAAFVLISTLVLHSPFNAAEQDTATFRNVINKVSRSRSLLMLQAVCDKGGAVLKDGIARCSACPSFTSASGDKSGFALANVVLGSFAQAGESEALLYMKGCETKATIDGGIVLLRKTPDSWSRLQYQKGLGFTECLKFRTIDDVSKLLCNHSSIVDGSQLGKIFWIDMSERRFSRKPLLRWYDNTASNPRELVSIFPFRFLRSDFNEDGRSDVSISFRIREQFIPEKYSGALQAINSGYKTDPPETLNLTYLFNGIELNLRKDGQENRARINQIVNKHLPTTDP